MSSQVYVIEVGFGRGWDADGHRLVGRISRDAVQVVHYSGQPSGPRRSATGGDRRFFADMFRWALHRCADERAEAPTAPAAQPIGVMFEARRPHAARPTTPIRPVW